MPKTQHKLLSTSKLESQAQTMHLFQLLALLIECPCHHLCLGSLILWQCSPKILQATLLCAEN